MKTREFINKAWNGKTRVSQCSAVFAEGVGSDKVALYSYGYHYPLLFKVNGKAVRNTRGYSNSTARHICWTRDIEAIDIKAPRSFRLSWDDNENIKALATEQGNYINHLTDQLKAKKRTDTQVYARLFDELKTAQINLAKLLA